MKITLNVDDEVLARAMKALRTDNKTYAIDLALREVARRLTLAKILDAGTGFSGDELREAIDPTYNLEAARASESVHGNARKTRSRR
ncbi:MAG: type II toxin-antitoxin system VapB family antitoxin [Terrimicrobiaceae bacterium]|nr:type II toxin-antitoxin system VapB family antitoxin [Terrimicrobiaceae bacterium]